MQQSAYDAFVGQTFGDRYRIDSVLGWGNMGGVFRATDGQTGAEVAVKMLDPVLLSEDSIREELIKRFQREITSTKTLHHPNIVKLLDSGTHDEDKLFLVLELLDGHDLEGFVDEPMPPERVSRISQQIASALEEAHDKGIIHRDLKPGNILLTKSYGLDEVVKVVDFGIARMQESHHEVTAVTKAGSTVGTPRYMAPEQAMAQPVSAQTDLYALGCIIYEMLTGDQVFYADTEMMVALAHINEPPPALKVAGMPEAELAQWQALLAKLLQKNPAERPASASEVVAALKAITPESADAAEQVRVAEESQPSIDMAAMNAAMGDVQELPTEEAQAPEVAEPRRANDDSGIWIIAAVAIIFVVVIALVAT